MKTWALFVASLLLIASCAGDRTAITAERPNDPGMTFETDSNPTIPVTTQNDSVETGICDAFDAYFDRLLVDPGVPRPSENILSEDIFDPEHPIANLDDGPFGQAWSSLLANSGPQDPADGDPQIDDEGALADLDELSSEQCGYPVIAMLSVVLSCSTNSDGVEECTVNGDPRIGYQELQVMQQRVDSFFDAGGVDWLSELPGEEVARRDSRTGRSEVLLRVREDQIPEIAIWIAEFLETNRFDLDEGAIGTLRSPVFWSQADHRSTYLSLTIIGGLFGVYSYPENPDGMTMSVRSLASPELNPSRGDELQDLYLIGSELSNSLLTDEEILPIYKDLGPDESLLLISI